MGVLRVFAAGPCQFATRTVPMTAGTGCFKPDGPLAAPAVDLAKAVNGLEGQVEASVSGGGRGWLLCLNDGEQIASVALKADGGSPVSGDPPVDAAIEEQSTVRFWAELPKSFCAGLRAEAQRAAKRAGSSLSKTRYAVEIHNRGRTGPHLRIGWHRVGDSGPLVPLEDGSLPRIARTAAWMSPHYGWSVLADPCQMAVAARSAPAGVPYLSVGTGRGGTVFVSAKRDGHLSGMVAIRQPLPVTAR